MVTFTCSQCGESFKKNAVEKHGFRCRFDVISCIDCFKEFTRSSYSSHNQCITEKERYEGKLYAGRGSENKGQKKQDHWLQNIEDYVRSGKAGPVAHQVEKLLSLPNVPRKKNKFGNFVQNCIGIRNPADVERLWTVIQAANRKEDASGDQQQLLKSKEQSHGAKTSVPAADQPDRGQEDAGTDKERLTAGSGGENGQSSSSATNGDVRKKRKRGEKSNFLTCDDNASSNGNDTSSPDIDPNFSSSCPDKGMSAGTVEEVDEYDGREEGDGASCQGKFSWKRTIKRIVRQSGRTEMQLKDLQRQAYALHKDSVAKDCRSSKNEAYQSVLKYASKVRWLSLQDNTVSIQSLAAT